MSQRRNQAPSSSTHHAMSPWRFRFIVLLILMALVVLAGRIVYLQVVDQPFLKGQGDARTLRVETIDAHRGMITDRDGEPLAVSTPVVTLWANPQELPTDKATLTQLAQALGERPADFISRVDNYRNKSFMYLKRQVTPEPAQSVLDLQITGVYGQHEYKRYYPTGEVMAQLLGVTNIDDKGQEGLELAYNDYLTGTPGKRRVLKDRKGRLVRDLHLIRDAEPGGNMQLSINLRLQYMAYRELKAAVAEHHADAGTLVMIDARNGEVLAMANAPSFNPNNRANLDPAGLRNRAITDAFEPGSVMKPLAMCAGLASGKFTPDTVIDTSPGWMVLDHRYTIKDSLDFGKLTMTGIITKSSNIGMTHMALALPDAAVWNMYNAMGLGQPPEQINFPGEGDGSLPSPFSWSKAKRATLAYGYGLSASALQIAAAYTAITNDGERIPATLFKRRDPVKGKQVVSAKIAHQVLKMMETVVEPGGSGHRAAVNGYRVAGKTGTVRKVGAEGYQRKAYRANFVGIAPASNPRIITMISIDNPKGKEFYGGQVAAPIFARVAGKALRLLDVPPDDPHDTAEATR
ncbi:peptidoglycan D,D-transpeptidase FtsI family protein [Larsenimonas rhizosphaerae]|uniref:Peptidoglycan D,D-transpeptidase FtsI n=1 Tax=Larsenimonas rhizosphaerae TaxID=2944682 RepID=A0AA41ZMS8_9GAMM|nr:penicillin-binding transpeptidase domain-containing protein [Larsenimonas rhizosphaerae]MCM2131050.1 penicillin-binding transpeptidase domain-containing protein [Larsenimonas rhizosphaerae]MCX2523755.1 penicillin-binding transpeptidase domain-containing protein [Larsenimonas rhizosphaerae]